MFCGIYSLSSSMFFTLFIFFLMIRRPPRSTRLTHSFPTRRSSDLCAVWQLRHNRRGAGNQWRAEADRSRRCGGDDGLCRTRGDRARLWHGGGAGAAQDMGADPVAAKAWGQGQVRDPPRSEEHTSELQSLMRISYAVFCLKKKNKETKT